MTVYLRPAPPGSPSRSVVGRIPRPEPLRERRERPAGLRLPGAAHPDPLDLVERRELVDIALGEVLDGNDRRVVEALYLDEESPAELARELGISRQRVDQICRRALARAGRLLRAKTGAPPVPRKTIGFRCVAVDPATFRYVVEKTRTRPRAIARDVLDDAAVLGARREREEKRRRRELNRINREGLWELLVADDRPGGLPANSSGARASTTTGATNMANAQQQDPDDFLDGIDDAQESAGGVYFIEGNYLVEVQKCKRGKTRKSKPYFVVETIILASDVPKRRPGSLCSWYVSLEDKESPALGNVRKFCAVATGSAIEEVKKAEVLEICSPHNPLLGTRLRLAATDIVTVKKKQNFTVCKWSPPLPGDEKVQIVLAAPAAAAPPAGGADEAGDADEDFDPNE